MKKLLLLAALSGSLAPLAQATATPTATRALPEDPAGMYQAGYKAGLNFVATHGNVGSVFEQQLAYAFAKVDYYASSGSTRMAQYWSGYIDGLEEPVTE